MLKWILILISRQPPHADDDECASLSTVSYDLLPVVRGKRGTFIVLLT